MVRDQILKWFPELEPDDVKSTSMGAGGEDVLLSPAARKLFPFSIECKNNKRNAIYGLYDQAVANAGKHQPLLIVKIDRRKPLAVIDMEYFMDMVKGLSK